MKGSFIRLSAIQYGEWNESGMLNVLIADDETGGRLRTLGKELSLAVWAEMASLTEPDICWEAGSIVKRVSAMHLPKGVKRADMVETISEVSPGPEGLQMLPVNHTDGPELDRACFEAASAAFQKSFKDLSHFVHHFKVLEDSCLSEGIKTTIRHQMGKPDLARSLIEIMRRYGEEVGAVWQEDMAVMVTGVIGDAIPK